MLFRSCGCGHVCCPVHHEKYFPLGIREVAIMDAGMQVVFLHMPNDIESIFFPVKPMLDSSWQPLWRLIEHPVSLEIVVTILMSHYY